MGNTESFPEDGRERSFPGAALLDNLQCGSVDDVDDNNPKPKQQNGFSKFFNHAETLCAQSPTSDADYGDHSFDDEYETFRKDKDDDDTLEDDDDTKNSIKDPAGTPASAGNPTSALFARALVSEVTDNPKTMKPAAMAEREKKLLKAQEKARDAHKNGEKSRPVGAPGGVGQPSVLGSIAHALTGSTDPLGTANYDYNKDPKASVLPPNSMSENRAQVDSSTPEMVPGKHTVTIGLSLTRRSSVGHQDTVTRQTAFDFNELQDRQYKYVSSTDSCGWRAGGGERGGPQQAPVSDLLFDDEGNEQTFGGTGFGTSLKKADPGTPSGGQIHKVAAPDTVHIPIIHIDAESPQAVDDIIAALARGEVFIPHMAIIPEALSVDGVSPPDLVVRFGTERNDDMPPDEWPNWCLEFMHNQLYEYFHGMGARWMKRPFSITLAKKVRWKTVKHMNRYFAHSERVIDAWREKGPQYLDPQLAYIEGGATPEEVARPHGIYLLRNGVPTNYFAPNFDPPYTTKMTRSLLLNVLGKSWDKKRREWTSEPIPRLVTPVMLVSAMCGCSDNAAGGFMAREATLVSGTDTSNIPHNALIRSDPPPPTEQQQQQRQKKKQELPPNTPSQRPPPSEYTQADTDIISDVVQGSRDPPSKTEPEPLSKQPPQQQQQQQQQLKTRPEQLSLDDLSLEEQRNPIDPVASSETEFNENKQLQLLHVVMNNSPGSAYSKECARSVSKHTAKTLDEELQELDDTLNLHVKSQAVPVKSPKYGQAPTPERLSSPRSALGEKAEDKSSSVATRDPDAVNQSLATPMDVGATSDYVQPSVTGTNSTIMHMNLSTEAFVKREFERTLGRSDEKKEEDVRPVGPTLASDEDWLDELGKPMPSPAMNAQTARAAKKSKNKTKEAVEAERERQIALIAMAQNQTEKAGDHLRETLNDPKKLELAQRVMQSSDPPKAKSKTAPAVQRNDSGVSLEYSIDSTYLGGDNSTLGGSTVMGQHIATDGSVATASTKGSRQFRASSQRKERSSQAANGTKHGSKQNDDEELSAFSHPSSVEDSLEVVPTDEELFGVGWAKALDPKSGSYYYFTLDRAQIVWDNPLAVRGSADSMDTSSIPPTAGKI